LKEKSLGTTALDQRLVSATVEKETKEAHVYDETINVHDVYPEAKSERHSARVKTKLSDCATAQQMHTTQTRCQLLHKHSDLIDIYTKRI